MIQSQGLWPFAREFISHPRQMGALFPSSHALAGRMASQVPEGSGIVVELGPGLGSITAALLTRGIPAEHIRAIEYSPRLTLQLRQRFPGVHVIEGDARHLSRLIKPCHRLQPATAQPAQIHGTGNLRRAAQGCRAKHRVRAIYLPFP